MERRPPLRPVTELVHSLRRNPPEVHRRIYRPGVNPANPDPSVNLRGIRVTTVGWMTCTHSWWWDRKTTMSKNLQSNERDLKRRKNERNLRRKRWRSVKYLDGPQKNSWRWGFYRNSRGFRVFSLLDSFEFYKDVSCSPYILIFELFYRVVQEKQTANVLPAQAFG